jgi:hypothetical protein
MTGHGTAGTGVEREAAEEFASYYGKPIVKPPVWKPELPWYFAAGGMAGASSMLALAADLSGRPELSRTAHRAAAVGAAVSPLLLIADLGVPRRFANMLRVFRPTSPLSLGAWLLMGYVPAAVGSGLLGEIGRLPRLQRTATIAAAAGGPPMITYTAVLISATAIPVWYEARRELPFVFAGTAVATAGGAAMAFTPTEHAGPARRLALSGLVMGQVAQKVMEHRLGVHGRPYRQGRAGGFATAAKLLFGAGGLVGLFGRRRRSAAMASGLMLVAGSVCERWSVFRAGWQSAEDPEFVVRQQRDADWADGFAGDSAGRPAAHRRSR